ncbi:MAG: succinate dehydrogenase, cytochrome b556 subunit [bacterium]
MHYRWKTGMWAWVLNRITGLALVGYLAMHIMVISNLHNPAKFDATMKFLGSWEFRLLEIGLFLVVLYHGLNGIRILIVDFFGGAVHHVRLFRWLVAIGVILFLLGTYPMFNHAVYWKKVKEGKIIHQTILQTHPVNPNKIGDLAHDHDKSGLKMIREKES